MLMNINHVLAKAGLIGEGQFELLYFHNGEKLYNENMTESNTSIFDFTDTDCYVLPITDSQGKIKGDWINNLTKEEILLLEKYYPSLPNFQTHEIAKPLRHGQTYNLSDPIHMAMFCMLQYQDHIAANEAEAHLNYDLGTLEKTHFWRKVESFDI